MREGAKIAVGCGLGGYRGLVEEGEGFVSIAKVPWVNGHRRRLLFWVAGSGRWSAKKHWAALSGGRGGESPPDRNTSVIFNRRSGCGTVVMGPARLHSLDLRGFQGTIRLRNKLTLLGSLTVGAEAQLDGVGKTEFR